MNITFLILSKIPALIMAVYLCKLNIRPARHGGSPVIGVLMLIGFIAGIAGRELMELFLFIARRGM